MIRWFWLHYLEDQFMPSLDKYLTDRLEAPQPRICVFGTVNRLKIINKVARAIVNRTGKVVLTGWHVYTRKGIYEWDDILSRARVSLLGAGTAAIPASIVRRVLIDPLYYQCFPQLCSKAVVDLTETGAQVFEVLGCYMMNIPMLGFIQISRERFQRWFGQEVVCPHMKKVECEQLIMCECEGKGDCPGRTPEHCPFISTGLPWSIRQLFLLRQHKFVVSYEIPISRILDFVIKDD